MADVTEAVREVPAETSRFRAARVERRAASLLSFLGLLPIFLLERGQRAAPSLRAVALRRRRLGSVVGDRAARDARLGRWRGRVVRARRGGKVAGARAGEGTALHLAHFLGLLLLVPHRLLLRLRRPEQHAVEPRLLLLKRLLRHRARPPHPLLRLLVISIVNRPEVARRALKRAGAALGRHGRHACHRRRRPPRRRREGLKVGGGARVVPGERHGAARALEPARGGGAQRSLALLHR